MPALESDSPKYKSSRLQNEDTEECFIIQNFRGNRPYPQLDNLPDFNLFTEGSCEPNDTRNARPIGDYTDYMYHDPGQPNRGG